VRFEDFVLHFDTSPRGGFRARVLKSPFGEGVTGFSLSSLAEEQAAFNAPGVFRHVASDGETASGGTGSPLTIGTELFRTVFQGQVRTLLDKSLGQLEISPNLGLRLKIKIDPSDEETGALADLPWELLCDGETEDFFALSRQTSLVRYLDVPRSSQPIPFTPPLRVLAVAASPRGLDPLDLAEEARRLQDLNRSSSGAVDVRFLPNASAGAVREALSGDAFNVLHFMGHGTFDPASGEGMLAFEGTDGSPDLVSGKAFATKIRDLRSLGVVMLNACDTARARHEGGANPFRGVASALVFGGVPAVVAMQRPISDVAAIHFSTAFYRNLARGVSIDEALTEGRQAIHSAKPETFEWAMPVLFFRIPNGNVFVAEPASAPEVMEPPVPAPVPSPIGPLRHSLVSQRHRLVLKIAAGAAGALLVILVLYTKVITPSRGSNHTVSNGSSGIQKPSPSDGEAKPKVGGDAGSNTGKAHQEAKGKEQKEPDLKSQDSAAQPGSSPVPAPPPVKQQSSVGAIVSDDTPSSLTVPGSNERLHRAEIKKKDQEKIRLCVKQRAWMAFFRDYKGDLAPVRSTLNTDHDEDWINLQFTDYDGPRIRLGVLNMINKSDASEERGELPVSAIEEMLTVALYNTKHFDVIEQTRSKEIEEQQIRNDVVEPSPTSIANIGKVLGAQYLVYGAAVEWTPDRASPKKESEVAITVTLTDVANGQVLFTTVERARLGEQSFAMGAPAVGRDGRGQKIPGSYAVQACANKAAFKIATYFRDRKWLGTVVDIKGADVYINGGSQRGMAPQTKLSVQAVKGVVKDAESGTVLGEDLRGIGTLEVIVVQNGFSIARIVEGCKGIKKGDRVELATNPVPPPMIPECSALEHSQNL
jgi:hypothetical protein